MTSTPVAGQLGALGEVHGIWNETSDEYGDYMGPDTFAAPYRQGIFRCSIQRAEHRRRSPYRGGRRSSLSTRSSPADGTGAYARTKESGTIELTTNSARTIVDSMTLTSQAK